MNKTNICITNIHKSAMQNTPYKYFFYNLCTYIEKKINILCNLCNASIFHIEITLKRKIK